MNLLDDLSPPSVQTKLTLPLAKVALLVFAEQAGALDLLRKELFFDEQELSILRQHPRYSSLEQALAICSNATPDELLARAEFDAVLRLISLVKKGDDKTALNAVKELLDRVKGKPVQTNRTISSTVTLDLNAEQLNKDRQEVEARLSLMRAQREKMLSRIGPSNTFDAVLISESPEQ